MGERKGTNKYYPPDYDPKKGGLNKFMGTHALRERARKLHLGILIIRFEMPYNIWCEGCGNHIGMGVRYNAEKTKVGMYYSTPVYQFRMKCHLCDNHFEMKTDPGNLDYVIVSGARRQENRWNPEENGQVVPDDKRVIRQLADDAMFKLQHGVEDKTKLSSVAPTLGALEELQERWKDDYSANKSLRDMFRTKKKEIKAAEEKDKEFLAKRSLDIPLLQETEEDAKIASLIRLQPSQSSEERQLLKRKEIESRSNFPLKLSTGDTKDNIIPATMSSSSSSKSSNQYKSSGFSHLNINSQTLAKQRTSLGISLSKKNNKGVPSSESVIIKQEPECMEVDSESASVELLSNLCRSFTQSSEYETPVCSQMPQEWTETVTSESPPPVTTSSTQAQRKTDFNGEENEQNSRNNLHKIIESSARSSASEEPKVLPKSASSSSKVTSGLSLVSCDYCSSSSGNEDD